MNCFMKNIFNIEVYKKSKSIVFFHKYFFTQKTQIYTEFYTLVNYTMNCFMKNIFNIEVYKKSKSIVFFS